MQIPKVNIPKINTLCAIALIVLMSAGSAFVLIPSASAHTPPWTIPTYGFLSTVPNPVGVGQPVTVEFWLDKVPPTASTSYGDRWYNLTVTVTNPAGTTSTYGPYTTSDVGAQYFIYTPGATGNYSFQMHFPGQTLAGNNPPPTGFSSVVKLSIGDYYQPCVSPVETVVVQQQAITPYPTNPLPTGYWQFPINWMNSNWGSIAGDWLLSGYDGQSNRYNTYTTAPMTAHVLWSYELAPGGLAASPVQATEQNLNYATGQAYEAKFSPAAVMDGNLIMNLPLSDVSGGGGTNIAAVGQPAQALDTGGAISINLKTGKTNWQEPIPLSFGQDFQYESPNQYGVISYLWSTSSLASALFGVPATNSSYTAFDPWTGKPLFCIDNVQANTAVFGLGNMEFGPNGEIITYTFNPTHGWLAMWNSTQDIMYYMNPINDWEWRPLTFPVMNWIYGVQWNNTNVQNYLNEWNGTLGLYAMTPTVLIAATGSISTPQNWQWEVGYSATTGAQLWVVNRTTPEGSTTWALMEAVNNNVYCEYTESTVQFNVYSVATGAYLFSTAPYTAPYGFYSFVSTIAYNMLIGVDFGGYLHAYNLSTGAQIWQFYAGNSGLTTEFGSWPLNSPAGTSADGVIYISDGHSYNPPMYPGANIYCVNATDGTLVWKELGFYFYEPIEVGDGVLVCDNQYDNSVYCYGTGRSATTVSANPGLNNVITLTGSVTDQSPGQTCLGIPAAGTPAIADAYMSQWMAYLYMQQPEPMNATGVPVTITYTDPNNNTYTLSATSDINGQYAVEFTPTLTGLYTFVATFAGTNSYYGSSAETFFTVGAAHTTATAVPTATPTSVADMYFVPAVIAIIVIVIIGFAVLAVLALRKRP